MPAVLFTNTISSAADESTLVFDETLNILLEQRAMELQVVVFQPHSLDVDKLIGHEVVRLPDCVELEPKVSAIKKD